METLDQQVARALEQTHQTRTTAHNITSPDREEYSPVSLVWVLKPPDLASQSKLDPKWRGPFLIKTRTGQRSYILFDRRGATFSTHVDQLKHYTALGDPGELAGLEGWDRQIERIAACRETADGETMYLIHWQGQLHGVWTSHSILVAMGWQQQLEDYLQGQHAASP